ncbi:MAG TPA: CDF family Co(II)/Ni(II) efflux transporter DmeF [Candidatus Hydrogenedentes bacterium]|nr:CDF family Co(II)/Ni(II) efflux transporter DmeF [Candidatus Hydrogenedentota bacterium]
MHRDHHNARRHSHVFNQDRKRPGERRTLIVIAITGVMMVIEIVTGMLFGSMALLADGLHMASHAAALSINAFAYVYARKHATDPRYSFGTGKVNALGGFSGALLLALFALLMAWESARRMLSPVEIVFNQAILVAFLGLIVNGICVIILGGNGHQHDHSHPDGLHDARENHQHDHNLRSAYLHVLADALTSVLAILALFAGKYLGLVWMDPLMGVAGAFLVARWSIGLLRATAAVLLDHQGPEAIRRSIRESIESDPDSTVADLHLWSIGPNIHAVMLTVVSCTPQTPDYYKKRIPQHLGLEHITVEVHQCLPSHTPEAE